MTSACSPEPAFRFWLRELRYGAQRVLIRLLIAVDEGRDVLPHVAAHQHRGLHGLDRRPRDHAAAVASPSRPDRRPGSCSSDSHGRLKRETQIDSIRSQSAYSAAIGTRQAKTGSRPGRLSRMPGVLRSSRRPLHLRICLQSANPALSTLAQGGDGVHLRRAVCWEIASQRGHCK